jgi:hypothetical protein
LTSLDFAVGTGVLPPARGEKVFERRSASVKEEAVETSPKLLTVDQAAGLLGLSSHAVVELIVSDQLTWTMAADKKTVIVAVPSDPDQLLRVIGASVKSSGAGHQPPPPAKPDSRVNARRQSGERSTMSDLDAWSQPK